MEPADMHSSDREVFVTDDDRRRKHLRRGAFGVTALACLWLIGLGVGMFGFGSLPGISLGSNKKDSADRVRDESDLRRPASSARPLGSDRPVVVSRRQLLPAGSRSRARAPGRRASTNPAPATPVASTPAQQPLNPAQRQRGWARKGLAAPPGQVIKAQPKPPPASRGQRRGQTTTTTATATTQLPPGQAKKTPPPEG